MITTDYLLYLSILLLKLTVYSRSYHRTSSYPSQFIVSSLRRHSSLLQTVAERSIPSTSLNKLKENDFYSYRQYLVEFRVLHPDFRLFELRSAVSHLLGDKWLQINQKVFSNTEQMDSICIRHPDGSPICVYVYLPDDEATKAVAQRCALIRSIIEVWGIGSTYEQVNEMAIDLFDRVIAPTFPISSPVQEKTWRTQFRRHGRAKAPDFREREVILGKYASVLRRLNGSVDLSQPRHELVYLEDWESYQQHHNRQQATIWKDPNRPEEITDFVPKKLILGRIISEGSNIQVQYDIKNRPFLGSTTMDEISSHLAAMAANISVGSKVLDPFCGTGSLLIACAHLGANVIGSDIDADGLGLETRNRSDLTTERSKNSRFRRSSPEATLGQLNGCTMDNFKHYNLHGNVLAWLSLDIADWPRLESLSTLRIKTYRNGHEYDRASHRSEDWESLEQSLDHKADLSLLSQVYHYLHGSIGL